MAGTGAADRLGGGSPPQSDEEQRALAELRDHVVVCNCNEKVKRLVEDLQRAAAPAALDVVLLVQDQALWQDHPDWHPEVAGPGRFLVIHGCPTEERCLQRAHIAEARAAVILADPAQGALADARSTLVAVAIERHNPQVHTVMELLASVNRAHLRATEVNEVICLGDVTEKLIAQSCITPGVQNVFERLLAVGDGSSSFLTLPLPPALAGQSYRALARRALEVAAPFIPVGFVCTRGAPPVRRRRSATAPADERRLVLNPRADEEPGKDTLLQPGDLLVVLARRAPDLERYLVGEGAGAGAGAGAAP